MAINTKDIEIKRVSELNEIDDPSGFWIFGSKTDGNGFVSSVRYSFDKLAEYVINAAQEMQLERRIALTMERLEQVIPIGEDMTIYKVLAKNVKKLELKANTPEVEVWTEIPVDGSLVGIELASKDRDGALASYLFKVTPVSTLERSSVYLQAKVKKN